MKKRKLIVSVSLVCLIVPCLLVLAENSTHGEKVSIYTHFKVEILDDEKLIDDKMLVDLTIIEQDNGGFYVEWNEVYINPVHERKAVVLQPVHHSTLDGSIRNVIVTGSGFSFVIDLSKQFMGEGRTLQIVGTKKEMGIIPCFRYLLNNY